MKIRNGFVSNSSASSFIIPLYLITDDQKQMIYDHIFLGKEADDKLKSEGKELLYEYYEGWEVSEDGFSLWCRTFMDNFRLKTFVTMEVGVPEENMILFGDGIYFYDLHEDNEYIIMKRRKKLLKIIENYERSTRKFDRPGIRGELPTHRPRL